MFTEWEENIPQALDPANLVHEDFVKEDYEKRKITLPYMKRAHELVIIRIEIVSRLYCSGSWPIEISHLIGV